MSNPMESLKKAKPFAVRKCVVCDAKFVSINPFTEVCKRPECWRMSKTGETMDDLVREASRMPDYIPMNNRDCEEFDMEKMLSERGDEELGLEDEN